MCNFIADLFFGSIQRYFGGNQAVFSNKSKNNITQIIKENQRMREENLKKLRPNLVHPDCQK